MTTETETPTLRHVPGGVIRGDTGMPEYDNAGEPDWRARAIDAAREGWTLAMVTAAQKVRDFFDSPDSTPELRLNAELLARSLQETTPEMASQIAGNRPPDENEAPDAPGGGPKPGSVLAGFKAVDAEVPTPVAVAMSCAAMLRDRASLVAFDHPKAVAEAVAGELRQQAELFERMATKTVVVIDPHPTSFPPGTNSTSEAPKQAEMSRTGMEAHPTPCAGCDHPEHPAEMVAKACPIQTLHDGEPVFCEVTGPHEVHRGGQWSWTHNVVATFNIPAPKVKP